MPFRHPKGDANGRERSQPSRLAERERTSAIETHPPVHPRPNTHRTTHPTRGPSRRSPRSLARASRGPSVCVCGSATWLLATRLPRYLATGRLPSACGLNLGSFLALFLEISTPAWSNLGSFVFFTFSTASRPPPPVVVPPPSLSKNVPTSAPQYIPMRYKVNRNTMKPTKPARLRRGGMPRACPACPEPVEGSEVEGSRYPSSLFAFPPSTHRTRRLVAARLQLAPPSTPPLTRPCSVRSRVSRSRKRHWPMRRSTDLVLAQTRAECVRAPQPV